MMIISMYVKNMFTKLKITLVFDMIFSRLLKVRDVRELKM
jgi:hypothetical protein